MSKKVVTLTPVALVTPTKEFVHAPSAIRPSIEVTQEEFVTEYADNKKAILVSFEKDGKSNPTLTTTYSGPGGGRLVKG